MKNLALILPIAFSAQIAFAQNNQPTGIDAERNLVELGNSGNPTLVRTYDNRYEGVKGTPYFFDEWNKATISASNKVFQNVEVRYNVYENNLQYRNSQGEAIIFEPFRVDSFSLKNSMTNQEYTFKKYPVLASQDVRLAGRFLAVLYEGEKTQLLMLPEKIFKKANYQGAYSTGNKYDELYDDNSFYFVGPDQKLSKIKLNKKNLLRALSNKQDAVQRYASSNNLDLNTSEGWAKVLAYYETL